MKRFYKDVTTGPSLDGSGWLVLLDGRPVRTPGKQPLSAPNEKIANILKQEWEAQDDMIVPRTMPVTTLLTTCIDRTLPERPTITLSVLSYLDGDLLRYRAPQDDTGLHEEQARLWDPWLVWFAGHAGHTLSTTTSLIALDRHDDAHMDVSQIVNALDDHRFNILQVATALSGSIVLALALVEGAIKARQMYDCVLCEELFYERRLKLDRHGPDPFEEKRRAALMDDLNACALYLALLD